MTYDPWAMQEGRDLDPLPVQPGNWKRIVACLNIWNDIDELRANYETWYPHVDHVIAVDGAYAGMNCEIPESTDGTLEFLMTLDKVQIVGSPLFWPDQCAKRSQYFDRAQPGDLLWRIDADESFTNAQAIRETPHLDVGWLRYTSPIYKREQGIPAVFAYKPGLNYRGRHHWVYDADGQLVSTQQIGGLGLLHKLLPITMRNSRGEKRERIRVQLAQAQRQSVQVPHEATASPLRMAGHEPLRILQLGLIDPGVTIARLHSAINTTTPHTSMMATAQTEWTEPPRQCRIRNDFRMLMKAAAKADVIHCHINFDGMAHLGLNRKQIQAKHTGIVIHHHGTSLRKFTATHERKDRDHQALRIVSNLELLQYGDDLHYMPNPVPFARYRALGDMHRPEWKHGELIIAHSPTKRENKATQIFLAVCERLNARGLKITPLMIERTPWADALVMKARAHCTFDSFWLGMQNSGLEAAAMGQPVIAGDEDCRREYENRYGAVPYCFANDEVTLEEQIELLATDETFYAVSGAIVGAFVLTQHDYPAVAMRYLELLDGAFKWREKLTVGRARIPA